MYSQERPAKWLLLFGLAASLISVFLMPPLNVLDGYAHWYRAVQVAQGTLIPKHLGGTWWGGSIPADALKLADLAQQAKKQGTAMHGEEFRRWSYAMRKNPAAKGKDVPFSNTAIMTPFAYLPGAFGVWLGRNLHLGMLDQLYLARIMNVLAFFSIMLLAMRVLPDLHFGIAALSIAPSFLFMTASVSADPMNFAVPVLWLAWCWRLALKETRLSRAELAGILCGFLALAMLKSPMILLATASLLIPDSRFVGLSFAGNATTKTPPVHGVRMRQWAQLVLTRPFYLLLLGIPALIIWFTWNLNIHFEMGRYFGWESDPAGIAHYMATHPVQAFFNIWNNLFQNIFVKFLQSLSFTGGTGTGYASATPFTLGLVTWLAMLWSALAARKPLQKPWPILLIFGIGLLFGLIIYTGFWMTMTPPDTPQIRGVQPRYFWMVWVCWILAAGWLMGKRLPFSSPGIMATLITASASAAGWMLALNHYQRLWLW